LNLRPLPPKAVLYLLRSDRLRIPLPTTLPTLQTSTEDAECANSRLVPATSLGSSAVHRPISNLRTLLEFLASKRIPRVWTDLEAR
jgi:hypothetical protein